MSKICSICGTTEEHVTTRSMYIVTVFLSVNNTVSTADVKMTTKVD